MKHAPVIIVAAIVLAGLAIGAYGWRNKATAPTQPQPATTIPATDTDATKQLAGSRYLSFTPEVLTSAASGRRVLFFYANWCPTCRPADQNLSDNTSQIPEDVTVIRVNYNDNETDEAEKALAEQYGITYQHTYVQIDAEGKTVTKWNGGQLEDLLRNLR